MWSWLTMVYSFLLILWFWVSHNLLSFLWVHLAWEIPIVLVLIVFIRVQVRGFFWEDRDGNELSLKEFFSLWWRGMEGITPLQQTITTLWSYPLVVGGNVTGVVIMILRQEWWLLAILLGSLPMILMGLLSTWQKYRQQRRVYNAMKEAELNIGNQEIEEEVVNNG